MGIQTDNPVRIPFGELYTGIGGTFDPMAP